MSRIKPVYVDGPLEGQRFDTDEAFVQAPDSSSLKANVRSLANIAPLGPALPTVTYQFQKFGFHMGGKSVVIWLGWCHGEPDAETVAKALLKPEMFERAEVRDMPRDLTR